MPPLVAPLDQRERPLDPVFFEVLNWMLPFMPSLPEETVWHRWLEDFGIAPGVSFIARHRADESTVVEGMCAGLGEMAECSRRATSSAELFGSREFLNVDDLIHAVGVMLGVLGNAADEFLGAGYHADAESSFAGWPAPASTQWSNLSIRRLDRPMANRRTDAP